VAAAKHWFLEVVVSVRPIAMRLLPASLREIAWARWYRHRWQRWRHLFDDADLADSPGIHMTLVPGDIISSSIAFTGRYEPAFTAELLALAAPGGLLVDVGANLGYFSLLWVAARPGNRTESFEASPRVLPLLRANVARNGFQDRIHIVAAAAGRERSELGFDVGPDDQTGWGGLSPSIAGMSVRVPVERVDDVVGESARVALLKIDVEGAELWVLQGCERLLRSRLIDVIWYEQNRPRQQSLGIPDNACATFLASCGYEARLAGGNAGALTDWIARPVRADA
jgi:FkbM family methyltransferase